MPHSTADFIKKDPFDSCDERTTNETSQQK
jgi:hypothetical protein